MLSVLVFPFMILENVPRSPTIFLLSFDFHSSFCLYYIFVSALSSSFALSG